ncbi:NAD(+) synthase [Echinicola jeungdonensis]|uniref:Glutamine-dependent NAD(+) synthetase n=1 Tax=Echinicola jeungdonensis TaxID=709343 RepID=A0ABV5J459_9BACT|nr:NAD(+) synthase [Echinicola jeungdonensis]MDN3670070.1 NAD(+) synthase [Echinicola jeungdonensis]
MPNLKIGGATVNQTPLDWKGNLNNIINAIEEAKKQEIELLCFPELAITGYGSEDLFLSYWFPQKALRQLKELLPHCLGITVCVGLPVRIQDQLYNCMAIIEDGELNAFMAKQFLAIEGVHYECRWFTTWKANTLSKFDFFGKEVPFGDIVFEKKGFKYAFEICEDAWKGDKRPGFRLKDRGVNLIFNPSASHFAMGKSEHRENLVRESSIHLNSTYFYVNLLGNESGRMIFDGEVLVAEKGKILLKNDLLSFQSYLIFSYNLGENVEKLAEVSTEHDKKVEFTQAVSLALFDYLRKSRSHGFVLSLSGGADSSSLAVLVAEMVRRGIIELGVDTFLEKINLNFSPKTDNPEKEITGKLLTTAYQGSDNSSKETFESARMLAESVGAVFYDWKISEEVASYTQKIEKAIGRDLTWETDDVTLQNIQARARSPIIWMLANLNNALLLTTSNRSEGDVGYATMDGDTSGSISPIAAVDKFFILQWLQWAEKKLGYEGLRGVNSLQPTAELRPLEHHQTDEHDLMPYSVIVEIERLAIRDRRSPMDIFKILSEELSISPVQLKGYIRKFHQLWSRNQWKRERLAPSFHLDEFNVDPKTWYRFPILSGGFAEELEELDQLDVS